MAEPVIVSRTTTGDRRRLRQALQQSRQLEHALQQRRQEMEDVRRKPIQSPDEMRSALDDLRAAVGRQARDLHLLASEQRQSLRMIVRLLFREDVE